jgi:hypothetical protein
MKHLIIPDTQVKPNTPIDHLKLGGAVCSQDAARCYCDDRGPLGHGEPFFLR